MKAFEALNLYKQTAHIREAHRKQFMHRELDDILNWIRYCAERTTSTTQTIIHKENIDTLTEYGYNITQDGLVNQYIISWEIV